MSITSNDTVALAAVALAVATDLHDRRIPNWLTGAVFAIAFVEAVSGIGAIGPGGALIGLLGGFTLMLPGYLFGGTGAGDVKLMAALGAALGPAAIVHVALFTAIAGGVLAVAVSIQRRRLGATLRGAASLTVGSRRSRAAVFAVGAVNRIPYAPAIAMGTISALALR